MNLVSRFLHQPASKQLSNNIFNHAVGAATKQKIWEGQKLKTSYSLWSPFWNLKAQLPIGDSCDNMQPNISPLIYKLIVRLQPPNMCEVQSTTFRILRVLIILLHILRNMETKSSFQIGPFFYSMFTNWARVKTILTCEKSFWKTVLTKWPEWPELPKWQKMPNRPKFQKSQKFLHAKKT